MSKSLEEMFEDIRNAPPDPWYVDAMWAVRRFYTEATHRIRQAWHYLRHGYASAETWSLDYTVAQFILPRLRHLREHTHSYPPEFGRFEDWQAVMDEMIFSFECAVSEEWEDDELRMSVEDPERFERYLNGFRLFGKWLPSLWD